jgi:diguanylate cyclase (GGDEF)-like protein
LIFRVTPGGLNLLGGTGRGVGWSGIVDLSLENEPLAAAVHKSSRPARIGGAGEPVRVIGPYWARHALLAPVGADHLVVFGSDQPLLDPDPMYITAAAELVANLGQISPAKLLSDELEVVHAIRGLMDYRTERVSDTARHVASKAAEALSCDVGAILVQHGDELITEVVSRDWQGSLDPEAIKATLVKLFKRTEQCGAILELELGHDANDALGRDQGLVARFVVPIGCPTPLGVMVLGHAVSRARGFTNLCQRIGYALADAAQLLLATAISREDLAADRDRFARQARIDPLTGLENRTGWHEIVAIEEARRSRTAHPVSIVSADLDRLKAVNDRFGHQAGDRLIKAAADVLLQCARRSDRVARTGGDEFLVLLPEADARAAARYVARVRAALRRQATPLRMSLSLGSATVRKDEALTGAIARADAAMYAAKKRRARRGSSSKGRVSLAG